MADPGRRVLRSVLFAPASRPELAPKLVRSGADAAILDLEDSVAPATKDEAREGVPRLIRKMSDDRPDFPVMVRVNQVGSPWFDQDLAVALHAGVAGVVVPKVESPETVEKIRHEIDRRELDVAVLAGVESARGVHLVEAILGAEPDACYFGAEDYIADLGGIRTSAGQEVLYARSRVALAAAVNDVISLDQVVVEFRDDSRFVDDAALGRALGYNGKLCINPRQVPLANQCFTPGDDEIAMSRRLLAAHAEATADGRGVFEFEGQMVDEPLVRRARHVVAVADAVGASE